MKRFKIHTSNDINHGTVHTPIVYVKHRVTWQYKKLVHEADNQPTEDALNELGEEGWELVTVSTNGSNNYMYFKRLMEEQV